VPRGRPLHPAFALAVFVLDREGMPYAELWRRLRPVANRLGERPPSYSQVRRLALVTRPVKRVRQGGAGADPEPDARRACPDPTLRVGTQGPFGAPCPDGWEGGTWAGRGLGGVWAGRGAGGHCPGLIDSAGGRVSSPSSRRPPGGSSPRRRATRPRRGRARRRRRPPVGRADGRAYGRASRRASRGSAARGSR